MDKTIESRVDSPLSRADLWPLLGLFILALVLYHPLFFGRPVMPDTWERFEPWNSELGYDGPLDPRIQNANNDGILQYTCWNAFAHRELRAGRIPAWDPYCLCGVPLAANHLVPVFYPPYALIAWLASPLFIMGISGLFHTLILGIFFYLFIREWLNHRLAGWMAASFLVVSLLPNPHYQPWPMTLAWFPAYWFFYERWLKHRSPWAGLWMSLCCAAVLLSGYPSLIFQLGLFTAVWVLIRPQMMDPADRPAWLARIWILVWPFLIAVGLSAVQNIPTLMAAMESDRTVFKTSEELAREASFTIPAGQPWQMHVKRLLQPMIPFRFPGNDFFNRGHVGVVPVVFALFGLGWLRRKEYPRLVALLALIVAPFALIPAVNFAAYWLTRGVLIDPNPPVEVFGFLVLMLMAIGVRYWLKLRCIDTSEKKEDAWGFLLAFIACITVWIASARIADRSFVPLPSLTIGAILAILSIYMIIWQPRGKPTYAPFVGLLVFWLAMNAFVSGMKVIAPPQGYSALVGQVMPETERITTLRELTNPALGGQWGRIVRYSNDPVNVMSLADQPYTFYPNLGTYFEIPDVFGYHNLAPASRMNYLRDIQEDAVIERRGIVAFTSPVDPFDDRLARLGARYILTDEPLQDIEPVYSSEKFYIYENTDAWPRILIRPESRNTRDSTDVRDVAILVDQPGHMVAEVEDGFVGRLVFNEGYSQGWRATVDGEPAEVHVVDGILMAIDVPAGEHTVEFRYVMPGLVAGLLVTALTCVLWLLVAAFVTLHAIRTKGTRH